eukprot:NODE_127_length_17034_cov_0.369590.p5 type:complete len:298 gc:universal NODE_127_length_17034_cov_0.369590:8608-7715(-)
MLIAFFGVFGLLKRAEEGDNGWPTMDSSLKVPPWFGEVNPANSHYKTKYEPVSKFKVIEFYASTQYDQDVQDDWVNSQTFVAEKPLLKVGSLTNLENAHKLLSMRYSVKRYSNEVIHMKYFELFDSDLEMFQNNILRIDPAWTINSLFYLAEWIDFKIENNPFIAKEWLETGNLDSICKTLFQSFKTLGTDSPQDKIYHEVMYTVYKTLINGQLSAFLKNMAKWFYAVRPRSELYQIHVIECIAKHYNVDLRFMIDQLSQHYRAYPIEDKFIDFYKSESVKTWMPEELQNFEFQVVK